ncbi:small integral membrane protein 8-like [Anneissia japonica]|uniref:small integral membrane protein 8-like n=1 Tax=Anneissia japonica TaxID=1529436 RepID=UPI001425B5BF|nr:small integral membrane protein 8-like [Anneissia japonica]XP_033122387.1 small integral membrane protein 8-like [Anneissia japonica]
MSKIQENGGEAPKTKPGLSGVRTTNFFRVFNFELFVKPNKVVMGLGLTAITGCVCYIAYMNAMSENKQDQLYEQFNEDGTTRIRRRTSRWD